MLQQTAVGSTLTATLSAPKLADLTGHINLYLVQAIFADLNLLTFSSCADIQIKLKIGSNKLGYQENILDRL